jgi:hypothetical protein
VIYEGEPGNPQGKRGVGSVVWSIETLSPGTGKPVVRADIDIPERKMEMTWRLRPGTDLGSSLSQTIEFLFKLPPDFPGSGIFSVPGIWMKEGERGQAIPLTGLAAKVATGDFLIGLSAAPADRERNLQQLKPS